LGNCLHPSLLGAKAKEFVMAKRLLICVLGLGIATIVSAPSFGDDKAKAARADEKGADKDSPFLKGLFDKFDKNKDGFLSKDELPAELQDDFDQADTDKDGKLSKQELVRYGVRMRVRQLPIESLTQWLQGGEFDGARREIVVNVVYDALRKMDTNSDGKISHDELKAGREKMIGHAAEAILKISDANGDGKISKDEIRGPLLKRRFAMVDTNKDGFIDRDELEKALHRGDLDEEDAKPAKSGDKPSDK